MRRGIDDRPEGSTTMTEASAEEYNPEDFNNDNEGVGGGYTTCPRDRRQWRRRHWLNDGPDELAMTTERLFYLLSCRYQ